MSVCSAEERKGPYVILDYYSSQFSGQDLTFSSTYDDDDSVGSSVATGLRNSLNSSFNFSELEEQWEPEDFKDRDYFGREPEDDNSFGYNNMEPPSWRLPLHLSGSDWKLIIKIETDPSTTEYNVHKHMLTGGFKKSQFFISLLQLASEEKADEEIEGATTTIHEDAVRLVPDMLDYIYSAHNLLNITTENAVGLLHLAQFFTIRAMATKVLSFIYKDISVENMGTYLASAFAFDDLQIMAVCSSRCAEQIKDISSNSFLLRDMDAGFLLDIISCPRKDRNRCSGHMSNLVTAYCDLHREKVDANVFDELTLEEHLPVISKDAAMYLLLLEADIVRESVTRNNLTCLQRRCIAALTHPSNPSSSAHSEKEWNNARAALLKLPKKVLVEIISASIQK
jgi:hypothetical protein